jgi:hypothetical protein
LAPEEPEWQRGTDSIVAVVSTSVIMVMTIPCIRIKVLKLRRQMLCLFLDLIAILLTLYLRAFSASMALQHAGTSLYSSY